MLNAETGGPYPSGGNLSEDKAWLRENWKFWISYILIAEKSGYNLGQLLLNKVDEMHDSFCKNMGTPGG